MLALGFLVFWLGFFSWALHLYNLDWKALFNLKTGLLAFLVFPILLFLPPAPASVERRNGKALFYADWARIFTGRGKSRHVRFFVEDVETFKIRQANMGDENFFLVTVRFKPLTPRILGRQYDSEFGLGVRNASELEPFLGWARNHQIGISEVGDVNQRRS